ncbi:hypothetical protein C8Q80DRAFT_1275407 [Daedaleopsis nitida]|nr:hypothetical protein C8Q80DRAFT_1275407 [Daedaleopsis nitida]
MSHTFFWPGKYFFYPIGNTSAVCLTRDLPPEESANLLLLGCGDPRHVIYTIFSEHTDFNRRLDFTCVDFEPGILARNVLLFTLIADEAPNDIAWNIFYHMHLDVKSHTYLIAQCQKLVDASASLESWRTSPYSSFLRWSTEYTLTELRRHWSLYAAMPDISSRRLSAIREAYRQVFKDQRTANMTPMTSARSAGPAIFKAVEAGSTQVLNYWKSGTTFFQQKDISAAKFLNPTFAYSLTGEGCAVHYATDPLTTFHFAALFGNAKGSPSAADMVRHAKLQFADWCTAVQQAVSDPTKTPRIRMFLAEATAACRALRAFGSTATLNLGAPVAQFRTKDIRLDKGEYADDGAPAAFNVVETSNLIDHLGLMNILVATIPLASPTPSSVLYTESLLFQGEDASKEFAELLHADIGTMGLLLDLCPTDYLSGFTTRSNTHELLMHQLLDKRTRNKLQHTQFHQVTTWKSPATCDNVVALHSGHARFPPLFDPRQLGTLLFDIYHTVFEQEDSMTFFAKNEHNIERAIASSNMIHYMREGFVLFLKLVRDRLQISRSVWADVMDRFMDLEQNDQTMPMNTVNRNDLYAHLHRQGVYTVEYYKNCFPRRVGRFVGWDVVPPVVRIVLSIPRENIKTFEEVLEGSRVGTPVLHCDVRGIRSQNMFSAIHVAYGRAIAIGSKANPRVIFEEDPEGRKGSLPLVVSFVMPALLLTDIEPPEMLNVRLCVRSTPGTIQLQMKMGLEMVIFSAKLLDEQHVHVLPEQPVPARADGDYDSTLKGSFFSSNATLSMEVGKQDPVVAELDEQCELVSALVARVDLEDADVIREFGSGKMPEIAQESPCVMRLALAGYDQHIVFPFPVVGSQNRLRLARKSRYIEVVVPPAGPFLKPDGMKLNPYPVVGTRKTLAAWNVHRLALNRLPVLSLTGFQLDLWLNPHVGSMLSARERKMRKKQKADGLLFVKDTIHTIFVRSAGVQGGSPVRVFALRDETTNNCDTVFFVSDLRYDLHSHTVVCDGYVLPLTHDIMPKVVALGFGTLVGSGSMADVRVFEGEMEAWKQLIPAFVERCRTWAHTDNCEYLATKRVPLTQTMEHDPLCSCGRGKDVEALRKEEAWRGLAPYVTRIALSPLFAVSYLEAVGRDPMAHKCSVCRGKGKPKLMACKGCQKVRYCSTACQKKDWPRHKPKCKA